MMDGHLVSLGLVPSLVKELGLYAALLKVIEQHDLGAHHGTIGLVMALKEEVHRREKGGVKGWGPVPFEKLSVDQFVHVLAFLAGRFEVKEVTAKLRKRIWRPHELEKQAGEMRGDELWPGLVHVPGVDMNKVIEMWENSRDRNKESEDPQVNGRGAGTSLCTTIYTGS